MSATRESGSIVGNSLKSIFARLTTNQSSVSALEKIGISINDVEGNVKSASTVIGELQQAWGGLTDAQRQQTAVGVFTCPLV